MRPSDFIRDHSVPSGSNFNVARDFSIISNPTPSNIWSYGAMDSLTGTFVPYDVLQVNAEATGLDVWSFGRNHSHRPCR